MFNNQLRSTTTFLLFVSLFFTNYFINNIYTNNERLQRYIIITKLWDSK